MNLKHTNKMATGDGMNSRESWMVGSHAPSNSSSVSYVLVSSSLADGLTLIQQPFAQRFELNQEPWESGAYRSMVRLRKFWHARRE